MKYLALLRGINVGGQNIIKMTELKSAFERQGFLNVVTYINSGNVLFESGLGESSVQSACEKQIAETFGLQIPVCVMSAADLREAMAHAPEWWGDDPDAKHNTIFVISPATTEEIVDQVGETKPDIEKIASFGRVIFWSAPLTTFSRTRLTKIVQSKAAYNAITVRNANTARKLAALAI